MADVAVASTPCADDTAPENDACVDSGVSGGDQIRALSDGSGGSGGGGVRRGPWVLLIAGLTAVVALGGVIGVFGFRVVEERAEQQQREMFVNAARRTATDLTTIDHTRVEADIQRIIDGATGGFREDFESRSGPFAEVVRQAKSTSKGTVTEAGVERLADDQGQVLVAVTVETSLPDLPEQEPRSWRMRLTVEQDGDEARVSQVEFVP